MKKLLLLLFFIPVIVIGQTNLIYYFHKNNNDSLNTHLYTQFKNDIQVQLYVDKDDLSTQAYLENKGFILLNGKHSRGAYNG